MCREVVDQSEEQELLKKERDVGINPKQDRIRGSEMKVIMDLCIVPLGVGVSVSEYVAACEKIINEDGLNSSLHAYGTNIEGVGPGYGSCEEVS